MWPFNTKRIEFFVLLFLTCSLNLSLTQDYDVSDIQCSFATQGTNIEDLITAKLKRPIGFKGAPLFADDRTVHPDSDRHCLIKQDPSDTTNLTFDLRITDFSRCGVLKRNGFVHVRVWFPQFPGVVMQSDQELIIMCKPPEPTVIENKAAGFAGSFPHGARVSGVVEETPGRLEYEVALYKEAPPIARISGTNSPLASTKDPQLPPSELPVDQAVPIGTKLQLRARISTQSVWKYVKLMEVTVSPDPDNPHANGAVSLVHDGCRNNLFATIIPHQPAKYRDRPNEVFLDFEAFLLSSMKERATLWIHSQIKACMDATDCSPDFCMDVYEPAGHGRRRRRHLLALATAPTLSLESDSNQNASEYTRFKENIEYTVIMPGDLQSKKAEGHDGMQCRSALFMSGFLVLLLTICIGFPFHKGNYLIEYLCEQLEIKEKDYFGLRYVDTGKQRHWLDLGKSIIKQCKDVDPILFSFRVKFYPADPFRLTGNGRLMLYQQLKRDLRHGRLYCSMGEAAALGALIVQEELGDYDEQVHIGDYVSSMHLALRQTDSLEKKIMELHRKREPDQDPHVAMDEFMGIARGLETYGIDPHPVKDHRGSQLYIGINHCGISTFVSGKRSQHFRWNEIHKLNFEGKMFIAHLSYTDASREPKKHTIGFKCSSGAACRYLWRCAIEQMLFFTLPNSHNAAVISGGGFFSWGTKFKYTGRTEREILTESINALREQKMTNSTASKRKASSVPATPSSPQEGELAQIRKLLRNSYIATSNYQFPHYYSGYSSLPRSTMSEPLGNCTMATTDNLGNIIYDGNAIQIPSLEPVSEEARLRASRTDGLNAAMGDMSDYYFRDSVEHSSTESGLTNAYADGIGRGNKHLYYASKQQHHALPNSAINSSTSIGANTSASGLHFGSGNTTGNSGATDSKVARQNAANNAKNIRKFHLLHAFIPSFIFVVVALTASAVFVLESESEFFERIRSMPEMISLRYQYYQPLKNFILHKLGRHM